VSNYSEDHYRFHSGRHAHLEPPISSPEALAIYPLMCLKVAVRLKPRLVANRYPMLLQHNEAVAAPG
jgi:hypothetical protein